MRPWSDEPLTLHANLVDAVFGVPHRAVVGAHPGSDAVPLVLTRRTSIVTRRPGGGELLRALRVPEWPVVHDDDGEGGSRPALELRVSDVVWTVREHLHASHSFDLHYTAAADEDGSVWLRFGDGVNGRELAMAGPGEPEATIELRYRVGSAWAGNVGLRTLVEIVRPPTGTDEQVALDALGATAVTNVVPAAGGRAPHDLAREKQELPASLRHGPLQRAVALDDYATVAMQVPGAGRAVARSRGGLFNTVMVLVDPEGADALGEELRGRLHDHLDGLRMAGREHIVLAAEYVPLEVELVLCAQPGFGLHLVRDRVLAELRPGTNDRPGWFHPDRLSFGDAVRLGDVLAFVQGIPGVRSVRATAFRPLGEREGTAVRDVIRLGGTRVARLDADPDFPEYGTLVVRVVGLDWTATRPLARAAARAGLAHLRHRASGGRPSDQADPRGRRDPSGRHALAPERRRGDRGDPQRTALLRRGADRRLRRRHGLPHGHRPRLPAHRRRRRRAQQPARPPSTARCLNRAASRCHEPPPDPASVAVARPRADRRPAAPRVPAARASPTSSRCRTSSRWRASAAPGASRPSGSPSPTSRAPSWRCRRS